MSYPSASLAYRRAATQQASVVGLVIALYDTLVADLQRAIAAMARNDIQERSNQIKHGFQVLGQLSALLDHKGGGAAAANLSRFYDYLRRRMLAAQFRQDPALLQATVSLILQVREAWQQVDSRTQIAGEGIAPPQADNPAEPSQLSFSCAV